MSRIEPPVAGTTDPRVLLAAANNAAWCASMCRAHGVETHQNPQRWWSTDRTPPYYPDVVTLDPATLSADALQDVDTSAGCSVKDSFGTLDLTSAGFHLLFEAQWIFRPAAESTNGPDDLPTRWRAEVAHDRKALRRWATFWGDDGPALFPGALLADPDVRLVHLLEDGEHVGVVALNRSAGAVGISNLVCTETRADTAWRVITAIADAQFPGLDLVGYEKGPDLEAALAAGFRPLGPLQVWGN